MMSSCLVIAFGFTNLAILGWLVVAGVPLLIHFLSRRRYRETTWAAMEYLVAAMRQSRRRMRLEQFLLLALRTLIVVLIVLAVAEPYVESTGFTFVPGGERTHRLLVIDGSYSMALKNDDGKMRFARAKALARALVEESPAGDGFTLVLMSSPPQVVVGTPALEPDTFIDELDRLILPQTTLDLPATFERVEEVLSQAKTETPGLVRAEVYFFTDLGKVGWLPRFASEKTESDFRRRVRRLAKAASLAIVDVGQAGVDNRAVTDVRVEEPFATVARPLGLTATVKNFGANPLTEQAVELWVDGRKTGKQNVDLAAGSSAGVRFSHRFSSPGEKTIEIKAPGDRLEVDNRRWLALSVKPCLSVLCVDGHISAGGGATGYLTVALAPQEGKVERTRVCPKVVPESALLEQNLAGYDCVFLCNVAQFTTSEAEALKRYVEEGGGLVFFLGDRVLADRYNRRLAENVKNPTRILPARLAGIVDKKTAGLNPLEYRHPIVDKFRGREQTGLLTTPISKYFKLQVREKSNANVVLATESGNPLVVEETIGQGRVVLVATSADTSWGSMPMWPSFVPLVHEILAYAVGGQIAERNRLVGDMLEGQVLLGPPSRGAATGVKNGKAAGSMVIKTPDNRQVKLPVGYRNGSVVWTFEETNTSGIYTVSPALDTGESSDDGGSRDYAVNIDTVESDLTKLTEEQLRNDVLAGVPIEIETTWSHGETETLGPIARRGRLAVTLLYTVFGLLLLESYLAWRFGHHVQ
ncbi:MAG: BatA domain-containing protein [Pirellulales bacterium]|nr:BatA domain-containing protein [Pirellulales bacterium]